MKNLVLRVGHSGERHDLARHEAVQKAVLAVPPARTCLSSPATISGTTTSLGRAARMRSPSLEA